MNDIVAHYTAPSGETLEIYHDESPESPREWDNLGVIIAWHPRYNLGDMSKEFVALTGSDAFILKWKKIEPYGVILPLYLYDHSGISISVEPYS